MNSSTHLEHIFRHEYGPLVASLVRRVGIQHMEAVEDSVQYAMVQALEHWPLGTPPQDTSSWLYKVALRRFISEIRQAKRREELLAENHLTLAQLETEFEEIPLTSEMGDSLLRMLFVACNNEIPIESQLVFTLKSLCGFSVPEIAQRLFISEANVYKRYGRAKFFLQAQPNLILCLEEPNLQDRLPMVQRVLYLVFTEGYLSSHSDLAIRRDLCEEAIHLAKFLVNSELGAKPESYALLALMYFHLARLSARQDEAGNLILFEHQNRDEWNEKEIAMGLFYLEQSAQGEKLSRYHLEAGIAAEHCMAPSFVQTQWQRIVESYELLETIEPSFFHRISRALALAELKDPRSGLELLQSIDIPKWLGKSYQWHAAMADLQCRSGSTSSALKNAELALKLSPNQGVRESMIQRWRGFGLKI